MRKLRNVIIWIIISVILQTGVLFYFNNYYFKESTDIKYKVVENINTKNKNLSITIPKDASNISVSGSGKYAYYYSGNEVHVVNITNGQDNTVKFDVDISNVYIGWRDDNDDVLVIFEKDYSEFKVYTYDPAKNTKNVNRDANNEIRSYHIDSSKKILSFVPNNISTLIYLKEGVSQNSLKKYIYKLDLSYGINQMDLPIHNIGDYYVFKDEDTLVYEDEVDKKVYMTDKKGNTKRVSIPGVDQYKLLNVDNDGNCYIGSIVNDKINKIYYASMRTKDNSGNNNIKSSNLYNNQNSYGDSFSPTWSEISLAEPLEAKDIYLSKYGDIYVIDNLKGEVKNLKNKKKTQYDGDYVSISNTSIVSFNSDSGKLIETKLQ